MPSYGGMRLKLQMNKTLLVDETRAATLSRDAQDMTSLDLSQSQVNDLELLLSGAYAPLEGYLNQAEHQSVCDSMRLADGTLWPLALSLEITRELAANYRREDRIALRDPEGILLAILSVEDTFEYQDRYYAGGKIEGITLPVHYSHRPLRLLPHNARPGKRIAIVTCGILHTGQLEKALHFAGENNCGLLIQALDTGNDDLFGRIRAIKATLKAYREHDIELSVLPATASGDARGWLLQALIAGNYGCSVILSSGDMSLIDEYSGEMALSGLSIPEGSSGDLPEESAKELERIYPGKNRQGFTVFFSGLSGSGKSTIANILRVKLLERAPRNVTLLDGDLVRKNLSSELTFSREHRNLNVLRIGFVAGEITRHGGIAICAPIAPYDEVRKKVRSLIDSHGGFILIHVATPLDICESRDRKGLYAMARTGKIREFTGISDPYEPPEDAEITIQTTEISPEQACRQVIAYLEKEGYLEPATGD